MKHPTEFLKRHSLVIAILLMFALTWPIDLAYTGSLPIQVPFIVYLFLGWGFVLAAVTMTGLTLGKAGVVALLKRYVQWRVGWKWYLAAFLLTPCLVILAVYIHAALTGISPDFSTVMAHKIFGDNAYLPLFILPFFLVDFIANGEEIGWRGYVLPRLQAKYSALTSTLILGVIWGLWHLPKFLPQWNTVSFLWFMVHILAYAILLTWLYNNTHGSLLLVTISHASANTVGVFMPMANTVASANMGAYTIFVLLEVLIAILIVVVTGPERLSRTEPKQVQETSSASSNQNSPPHKGWNWLRRAFISLSILIFVLGLTGLIYQTAATEADKRNFPPPGNLIDVGGFKMHIHCLGEGSPTVILETLSGGTSSYWGWVQPDVAQTTRVCVYDRAGRGWSEPDPEPITLARTVRNLHTLLTNAGVDGPYILVGHSLGGIYIRQFAADYPDEVVGMVLVDAAHPEQFGRFPEMLAENEAYLNISSVFPPMARLGIARLYFALGGEFDFGDLAEPHKSVLKTLWSSPEYFASQRAEVIAAPGLFADGQKLGGLDDLPLIVLTQAHGDANWMQLQNEFASLSSNSLHQIVEGSTHASLAFNPEHAYEVSLAILQIWNTVQSGESLQ